MKQKHFFASANTGFGFKMNFDQINTQKGFVYVIKGGSGTGKSSLMKKIGNHFLSKGFDVEFVHCSTDVKSLDGVRICDFNILVLDGTAPHVVEANALGVEDKIVNVGQFVSDDIQKHKQQILDILKQKQFCYKNFYELLSASQKIQNQWKMCCDVSEKSAELKAQEIFKLLNLEKIDRTPFCRNMFLSAIGGDGKTNLVSENEFKQILNVTGNLFFASKVFENLNKKIANHGFDTICFCDVLNPNLLEGICVPAISTLVFLKPEIPTTKNELFCKNQIDIILRQASNFLNEAKQNHLKLEEFYISHTKFKEIDKLTKKLILEIEGKIRKNH